MQCATEENLTDLALERWEACHSPRLRQIMRSLYPATPGSTDLPVNHSMLRLVPRSAMTRESQSSEKCPP